MQENIENLEIAKSVVATVLYADGKHEEIDLGINDDISSIINGRTSSYIKSIRRIRFTVTADSFENGVVYDKTYDTPWCILGESVSSDKCVSLDGSETFEAAGDSWHLADSDEEVYVFRITNCDDPNNDVSNDYLCEPIIPGKVYNK